MNSIFRKIQSGFQPASRPPAAVELSPGGVLAAAIPVARHSPVYAFAPLAEGIVLPSLNEVNLRRPEAVAAAIRSAFGQVSPRTGSITLILPDPLVRVFVLDFDALPARAAEAVSVLRFRMRKMVPFDVEHASVSYQILEHNEAGFRVLAAIIPGPVLTEYESAVRDAGYEPGVVLSSSLAALEAVDSMEAVLTANLSRVALTTTICSGQDLLLYRTLDLPGDPTERLGEIQRGIAVATAYYEDRLRARPQRIYYAGSESVEGFARSIADSDLAVVESVSQPEGGAMTPPGATSLAAVYGALVGVR